MTREEFEHYPGCNHHDPDNCGACALTDLSQDSPNYAAWPLVYMENSRAIPAKWRKAFWLEFAREDNDRYVENLKRTRDRYGVLFSDDE